MRINATGTATFNDEPNVGDEVEINARARITGIQEEIVDVASFGASEIQLVAGERTVTLIIVTAQIDLREDA